MNGQFLVIAKSGNDGLFGRVECSIARRADAMCVIPVSVYSRSLLLMTNAIKKEQERRKMKVPVLVSSKSDNCYHIHTVSKD